MLIATKRLFSLAARSAPSGSGAWYCDHWTSATWLEQYDRPHRHHLNWRFRPEGGVQGCERKTQKPSAGKAHAQRMTTRAAPDSNLHSRAGRQVRLRGQRMSWGIEAEPATWLAITPEQSGLQRSLCVTKAMIS